MADERLRVLVAGGGVAGLEATLALHHLAGERVEVTLVSPHADFLYKPMRVAEPFGAGTAERVALGPALAELGAAFVRQAVTRALPAEHAVETADGRRLGYDALAVCVGARSVPALRTALTFDAATDPAALSRTLAGVERHADPHLAFVVPSPTAWSLPIYELALMTARRLAEHGRGHVRCTIVTPEDEPLALFGHAASAEVSMLLAGRGIDVIAAVHAREREDGRILLTPGDRVLEATHVVALPRLVGPAIEGLPSDADGFVPVDEQCRVPGVEDVYAAGDGTTFPVKQGGIATQQADALAEAIAARAGADVDPQPFHPVLRGMLLTGDESFYARTDITGGAGAGVASYDRLWWPPQKIGGRYLAPWLAHEHVHEDLEPPVRPIEVEASLPSAWPGTSVGL